MFPTLFHLPIIGLPIHGYGLMLMIAFLGGTWWAARRAAKVKADPDFVINLGFTALIASIIGARLFFVIHYWERFEGRGVRELFNLTSGGMEFYGGFIGAFIATVGYIAWKKNSIRLYADIVAPSIMFGMGAARIGCFLNGCCWGAPCHHELPWSVQFPVASPAQYSQWEDRLSTLPAELIVVSRHSGMAYPVPRDLLTSGARDDESLRFLKAQANQFHTTPEELRRQARRDEFRSLPVHPAQLYASVSGFVLAFLLNAVFHRRIRQGAVFGLLLVLYPVSRLMEEVIRIDNPQDVAGMTASQFVSLLLIVAGIVWLIAVHRMPLRSPYATEPAPAPISEPKDTHNPHKKKKASRSKR